MEPPPPPAPASIAAVPIRSAEPHSQVSDAKQAPRMANSNTLCKALIVVILLLVIPLFPSQAPDFITHSVFTEFWEILHLLFVGIAVSYGLFCRKSDQFIHPDRIVHSRNDESHTYLSGISHLTSFFEDGSGNICAPDEHDAMHIYGRDKSSFHEGSKIRAFNVNGDNVEGNQTWRSQYLKNESLRVVSNAKYFVGESSNFQPLNLPVRSLRSSIVVNEKNESNCKSKIEAKIEEDSAQVIKIRGVVPMNLEKKFDEVSGPSPIPWRSNSTRAGSSEDKNKYVHCRPRSVGEVEFEHIKSRSYTVPKFSSSPELVSSSVETVDNRKGFSVSRSKVAPLNGEGLFVSGEKSRVLNGGEEDTVGKWKHGAESMELGMESSGFGNVLSKAKSVRTIKPRRYTMDEKEQRQMRSKFEAENPTVNHQDCEFDSEFPVSNSKSMFDEFRSEEKEGADEGDVIKPEETKSMVDGRTSESRTNLDIDSELEGSEVDRKAGEFIAKFREQIRLQKVSSTMG